MATGITTRTAVPAHLAGGSQSEDSATANQRRYLADLAATRAIPEEARHLLLAKANGELALSKEKASEFIDRLLAKPKLAQEDQPGQGGDEPWSVVDTRTWENMGQPSKRGEEIWAMVAVTDYSEGRELVVPRGSYALENLYYKGVLLDPALGNDVAFYSVWINKDGTRWTVRRYSSDELVKLPRSQQYAILERIAEDPAAAAERYGLLIGKCGICHRKLTNQASRERGIGPVCAERHGW